MHYDWSFWTLKINVMMLKCNMERRAQWLELLDLENQRYAVAM